MPARNEPRVVAFERGMIVSAGEPGVGALADSGGRLVAQAGTAGAYARTVSESDLLA